MGQFQKADLDLKFFLFRFCWEKFQNYKVWLQRIVNSEGSIVAPTLIFRHVNLAENRYEMPPGLVNRKVHFDVRTGPESSFYDKRVNVMWQEKAYKEAPLRRVPKSVWLQKWAQKYDFPLCKRKAGRWVKKNSKRCKRRKRLRKKFLWILLQ